MRSDMAAMRRENERLRLQLDYLRKRLEEKDKAEPEMMKKDPIDIDTIRPSTPVKLVTPQRGQESQKQPQSLEEQLKKQPMQ